MRVLAAVLALTLGYGIVEAVGGWLTGSLALLADAAHMGSDASSLALALFAAWLAARPPTPRRSFGFARAEILAALANGIALVVLGLWILVEAVRRLDHPSEVDAGPMLAVAVVGLGVNALALWLLARRGGDALNVRAALWHVVADLAALGRHHRRRARRPRERLGAGRPARRRPRRAARRRQRVGRPPRVGLACCSRPRRAASTRPRWAGRWPRSRASWRCTTCTSGRSPRGFPALSAHVLVEPGGDCHGVRRGLGDLLRARFAIEHTTLQVDHAAANGLVSLGEVERRAAPLDGAEEGGARDGG